MDGSKLTRDAEALDRIRNARGFIFDLDGTLVLDKRHERLKVLDGAAELIALLNRRDIPYVLLTNGTASPPLAYERSLTAAGLPVPARQIMTPASVAAEHFIATGMKRILALGVEGVWQPLKDAGLEVLLPSEAPIEPETEVDAVFAGWYREFLLDEIEAACNAVWGGAELFAASLVPFFATPNGRALGSSRAVCAMITSVTDVEPVPIGKPSPIALACAARRLNRDPGEIAVVGDDPELETKMALDGGAIAIAVHSGNAGDERAGNLPESMRPDLAIANIAELLDVLR